MSNEMFINELNNILNTHSILKHPFYQRWNEGKLSLSELKEYARQYFYFVKHFPMFVSSVHSNCDDIDIRKMLVENIADEDGYKTGIADHPQLWRQFAEALGVTENELEETNICEEVKSSVQEFYNLCRDKDFRIGLATLYGYEKQIPEVSKVKLEGLERFYNITDKKAVEFFTVHHEADVNHSNAELAALLRTCVSEQDRNKVLESVRRSAELYWKMLDGVYMH